MNKGCHPFYKSLPHFQVDDPKPMCIWTVISFNKQQINKQANVKGGDEGGREMLWGVMEVWGDLEATESWR